MVIVRRAFTPARAARRTDASSVRDRPIHAVESVPVVGLDLHAQIHYLECQRSRARNDDDVRESRREQRSVFDDDAGSELVRFFRASTLTNIDPKYLPGGHGRLPPAVPS